ncbi:MAG: Rossmann-like domain-containing protein [Anaerolineae bacterium]
MSIVEALLEQTASQAIAAKVLDVRIGAHWTVVVLDLHGERRAGISSTLHGGDGDHHHGGGPPVRDAGGLLDYMVPDLAALVRSDEVLEASIGVATINALLDIEVENCVNVNAADVIAERGADKKVAIVGHFPFIPHIRSVAAETWVLELEPREGDVPAVKAPELIPQADVVALTGTSLLNHTFDGLIKLCRPDAYVLVLGGTTPLSPLFFDYGVDAVAGTRIVDADATLRCAGQGATFKQLRGKELLTLFRPGS